MRFFSLKKIFGLFAAAALAVTGLTCCGGGGGDSNGELTIKRFTFKKLRIQAPGTIVDSNYPKKEGDEGYDPFLPYIGTGNGVAGAMWVNISDRLNDTKAVASGSFGEDESGKTFSNGRIEIVGGTPEAPQVCIYFGNDTIGKEESAWAFFASFLPDDTEEGDTVVGIPAPYIIFDNWTDKESGTCTVKFNLGAREAYVSNVSFELTPY